MKTYILRLESHDDLISVRDKLGWAQARRILLVWPEQNVQLNRRLELKLIQRTCASLGAQLALVSCDPDLRLQAALLGIPIFRRESDAHSAAWRAPRRFRHSELPAPEQALAAAQKRRQELQALRPAKAQPLLWPWRLAVFTLGVLALLALAAVLLPSAEVTLQPDSFRQTVDLPVKAGTQFSAVNLSGQVPAKTVSVIVEGRASRPTSGQVAIPQTPASGTVRFTNLTDQQVTIPAETVVRASQTPELAFQVTSAGQVAAGPGETITLTVQCQTPGSAGNLPAGALNAIEGILGTRLTVTNPEPLQGGSDSSLPAATVADQRLLQESLQAALQETALQELRRTLGDGDLLIPESLQLLEIVEATFDPPDQEPASQLQLSLRARYSALVIAGVDLKQLMQAVLNAQLPSGYSPQPDSLEIALLEPPKFEADGYFSLRLQASQQVSAQITESRVVQLLLGQPPQLAVQRLQNQLALQAEPRIQTWPPRWPRLPILPFRLHIHLLEAVAP